MQLGSSLLRRPDPTLARIKPIVVMPSPVMIALARARPDGLRVGRAQQDASAVCEWHRSARTRGRLRRRRSRDARRPNEDLNSTHHHRSKHTF